RLHRLGDKEAELGDLLERANVGRQLEERQQARALAWAEAVAELLEVAGEEAGRVAVALARLAGEALGLGARTAMGIEERGLELGNSFGRRIGAGKDRVDHRQPGALEPQAPEVVMRRRVLEHALERGVADEELGIGVMCLLER